MVKIWNVPNLYFNNFIDLKNSIIFIWSMYQITQNFHVKIFIKNYDKCIN